MIYNIDGTTVATAYGEDGAVLPQAYNRGGMPLISHDYSQLNLLNSQEIVIGSGSPQGMATYNGYIFQFYSGTNMMKIYRMSDYGYVGEYSCTIVGHGNNLQFGNVEQQNGYPLMYASDAGEANSMNLYVISLDLNSCTLVDTITLPSSVGYYPNSVIDFVGRKIYSLGYTSTSITSNSNYIVSVLDLDNPSVVIDSWQVPYLGVLQGLVWDGGQVICQCSYHTTSNVKFHFINVTDKTIDTLTFNKELDSEYQGMALETGYILVSKWVYKYIDNVRRLFYEFYELI